MGTLKAGDIFLVDSDRFAAKMVKFLMTAPTVWHHVYRAIRGTQQEVRFYHAGMCIGPLLVIEQQSEVEVETVPAAIYNKSSYVVWRRKGLTPKEELVLMKTAQADMGDKYDWLLIIGSFLTWFTGIKWFRSVVQLKKKEFCITIVGKWYFKALSETFGAPDWHNLTTDLVDDWCRAHPEEWEVVEEKIKEPPFVKAGGVKVCLN